MASGGPKGWSILAGMGIVGLKVAASAAQLPGQSAVVAITWLVTVSFVTVGLMLLRTDVPPANGWGCLLVALCTVPGDLNDPHYAGSVLSAIGFVLEPLYLAAAAALVLRYPRARLTRGERSLLTAMLGIAAVARVGAALTTGSLADGFYRPADWSTLTLAPFWHDVLFVRVGRVVPALLLVAVAGLLAGRLRRAHGLSRQSQAPLVAIGMICALAAAVDQLVWAIGTPAVRDLPGALVRNLSAALIPVALLADLLRRRAAGAAVSHEILTAALTGGAAQLQQALRDVFVDRSATVELPDARGGWLDLRARPVLQASEADVRHEVIQSQDGAPLLRIGLDPRAVNDETLVATAVEAIRVGLQNTRLKDELLAALSELGSSRQRIVEASLAERRRVERDLHDGAQQHFLAVAATLAQADLVDDVEVREIVSEARSSLSDALDELRSFARGIHPAALSQGGLPAALPLLCDRAPWPVRLHVDPDTRHLPEPLEATAYFVVAELLSNAARHARASGASVGIEVVGHAVRIDVIDDGVGGARPRPGGGLAGLRDRIHALGGTMRLSAAPGGAGTTVQVTLPLPEAGSAP